MPESERVVPPEPVIVEDEAASTFLPLEFFDGGEMESMPDALWEDAESLFLQGKPFLEVLNMMPPDELRTSCANLESPL